MLVNFILLRCMRSYSIGDFLFKCSRIYVFLKDLGMVAKGYLYTAVLKQVLPYVGAIP